MLRILFVGYFQYNSGSSHTLLGYSRAAQHLGYDLRASTVGLVDDTVREIVPVADADWRPDIAAIVFETKRFLDSGSVGVVERIARRSRRVVIDPDGKYWAPEKADADTNHPTDESFKYWTDLYDQLSDRILQPSIGQSAPGTIPFLYFGIDSNRTSQVQRHPPKPFGLVYVGNNWYRWNDFLWLLRQIEPIRDRLGRVALFGKHWFGDPKVGLEEHTFSDPYLLRVHRVETYGSVPFDCVERAMGLGRLHPIFVRPILRALRLATPRMFETFAADTVPIIPPSVEYVRLLYGAGVEPLLVSDGAEDRVLDILDNYPLYQKVVAEIRDNLAKEHSYEARLAQLLEICG